MSSASPSMILYNLRRFLRRRQCYRTDTRLLNRFVRSSDHQNYYTNVLTHVNTTAYTSMESSICLYYRIWFLTVIFVLHGKLSMYTRASVPKPLRPPLRAPALPDVAAVGVHIRYRPGHWSGERYDMMICNWFRWIEEVAISGTISLHIILICVYGTD